MRQAAAQKQRISQDMAQISQQRQRTPPQH
jgi:hypothetical protein